MQCIFNITTSFSIFIFFFFFNDTATTEIYTLSLHDALPISSRGGEPRRLWQRAPPGTLRGLDRREPPGLGPDGSREGPVLLNVLWCLRALHDGAGQVIDREVDQRCREVHGHPVLAALLPRLADFRARDLDLLDAARPPRAPELVALGLEAGVLLRREPIVHPA